MPDGVLLLEPPIISSSRTSALPADSPPPIVLAKQAGTMPFQVHRSTLRLGVPSQIPTGTMKMFTTTVYVLNKTSYRTGNRKTYRDQTLGL